MKIKCSGKSAIIKLTKKENSVNWEKLAEQISLHEIQQLEILASEELDLSNFPTDLNGLSSLTIAGSQIHSEHSLAHYTLEKFKMSGSSLEALPEIDLRNLKFLFCPRNKLHDFQLTKHQGDQVTYPLKEIDLGQNKLKVLDLNFGLFPNITRINLENNQLQELPDSLFQLKNLTHLALKGNPLTEETQQKLYDVFQMVFE